ncbi:MAG TPA: cytochrome c3 family protein [Sandaracinaceae bacterium LLY-WYZ-13_1]|nr:cytochrome c3 family protein [Sandaracinaceae bacterium LLY-WYZ-13_1]
MQIFPKSLNFLPLVAALGVAVGGGVVTFVFVYYFSPDNLQVGYAPEQPVPYSHRLHAGELGMDCRYCHANVERSYEAMVPPTQTCMGCHSLVQTESARLEPVRESWETGDPIEWVRVHKIPDHAYFDHSVHLSAGVGCVSCHGRVDRMEVVSVQSPLSMGWCLDCHRDPMNYENPNGTVGAFRPTDRITDMTWNMEDATEAERQEVAALFRRAVPPEQCSGCHR